MLSYVYVFSIDVFLKFLTKKFSISRRQTSCIMTIIQNYVLSFLLHTGAPRRYFARGKMSLGRGKKLYNMQKLQILLFFLLLQAFSDIRFLKFGFDYTNLKCKYHIVFNIVLYAFIQFRYWKKI